MNIFERREGCEKRHQLVLVHKIAGELKAS